MMKYVFVLALLHLCVSAKSDNNLNTEIIKRLTVLRGKARVNAVVKAPVGRTPLHSHKCLGVIKKELGNLLDNVTVEHEDKHYIQELKGNLEALGDHKENDTCLMKPVQDPFRSYISFFRKLNNKS